MDNLTFENALKLLEEKVALLEKGDMPLDETVKLYDEAVKLSGYCGALLDNAKIKISNFDKNGVNEDE